MVKIQIFILTNIYTDIPADEATTKQRKLLDAHNNASRDKTDHLSLLINKHIIKFMTKIIYLQTLRLT